MTLRFCLLLVALLGAVFTGCRTHAADAAPVLTPGASPASQVLHSWLAWIPFITPLFLAGLRLIAPRIPKVWIPTLAGLLPAVVEAVASMSVDGNTALAALLGLAGTGARELTKQLAALPPGAPPAPPAAGMTRAGATYALAALLALTVVGCKTTIESEDVLNGRFVRVETPSWPWSNTEHTLGRLNVTVATNKTTFALRDYDAESDVSTNAVAALEKAAEGFGRGAARGLSGR